MHPIMLLAFVLLAAVAFAPISYLASAPDLSPVDAVDAGPAHGSELATPNHDPHHARLVPPPTPEPVATADSVAYLASAPDVLPVDPGPLDAEPVDAPPAAGGEVATPNHDARRAHSMPSLAPMPSFALNPVALRAEPEAAAPSAPAFAGTDTMLSAKDSARLRAAPSTAADVLTKLAADTPLRAIARSTNGAWWRVSLADGRIGYVHRTAVTQYRVVKTKPPAAPAPVVAVAAPQPAPARRSQGLLGYVDETMNWLADKAGHGTAPTIVRTER